MKKLLPIMAFAAIVLAGCGGSASKKGSTESETREIEIIDSITSRIDSLKMDIEESSRELDEMLEGI